MFWRFGLGKFFLIGVLGIFFCAVGSVEAGILKQIPYTGILKTSDGNPAADDDYAMTFKIYSIAAGGVALWTEAKTVTVTDGDFSTMLGSVSALNLDFDQDTYYLGIAVGGNAEMTPRQRIGAAAYAFNADKVDGADAGNAANNVLKLGSAGQITISSYAEGLTYLQFTPGDAPASPTDGQIYYDDDEAKLFGRIDGDWVNLGSVAGSSNLIGQGNTEVVVEDNGADGTIVFSTEGIERMRISDDGSVDLSNAAEVNVKGMVFGDNNLVMNGKDFVPDSISNGRTDIRDADDATYLILDGDDQALTFFTDENGFNDVPFRIISGADSEDWEDGYAIFQTHTDSSDWVNTLKLQNGKVEVGDGGTAGTFYSTSSEGLVFESTEKYAPIKFLVDGKQRFSLLTSGAHDGGGTNTEFMIGDPAKGYFTMGVDLLNDAVAPAFPYMMFHDTLYDFDAFIGWWDENPMALNLETQSEHPIIFSTNGSGNERMRITEDGLLKLMPAVAFTCDVDNEGGIYYDSDDNTFYGCDGNDWQALN